MSTTITQAQPVQNFSGADLENAGLSSQQREVLERVERRRRESEQPKQKVDFRAASRELGDRGFAMAAQAFALILSAFNARDVQKMIKALSSLEETRGHHVSPSTFRAVRMAAEYAVDFVLKRYCVLIQEGREMLQEAHKRERRGENLNGLDLRKKARDLFKKAKGLRFPAIGMVALEQLLLEGRVPDITAEMLEESGKKDKVYSALEERRGASELLAALIEPPEKRK